MNATRAQFVRLCDVAIQEAEKWRDEGTAKNETWVLADSAWLLGQLNTIRRQAMDGTLEPYNGVSLAIGRALSDWGVDGPLHDVVDDVEDFYRRNLWSASGTRP